MAYRLIISPKSATMKQSQKDAPKAKKLRSTSGTQPAESYSETVKFLEERIADGGATTDHLQAFLNKIRPPEQIEQVSQTA